MAAYFDASALLPATVREPSSAAIDQLIRRLERPLFVSEFAASEVASGVSRLVRTRELLIDKAVEALADFDAWRTLATEAIELRDADIRLAHTFVRRFELMLRTSDALHLAICRRTESTLVTLDHRMGSAANALGIPVEPLV